jgi:aspartate/methionine/tyrosine aminotransferase
MKPSDRANVEPFHAMDIMSAANKLKAEGDDVIFMCVGQPAAPAPKPALEAASNLLKDGRVGYTNAMGLSSLRERIARHYQDYYDVKISPERVAVTTGSSAGFNLAFLSLFDVGDRVAIASPAYPAYRNILKALGLEVVEIEVDETTRWQITGEQIGWADAADPKGLAGVLIASPGNPTGTSILRDEMQEIIDMCKKKHIHLISDEIYHGLSYNSEREHSALNFTQNVVVINSFSKYYCMTGWRVGWMILPEYLERPVERIAQSLYISAPTLSQVAAQAAFDGSDELEQVKSGYAKNRAYFLQELPKLGITEILPILQCLKPHK